MEILIGSGRPVPDPRQLLHIIRPEPPHVLHPLSPSDQRLQTQLTRPVPLQLEHLGPRPIILFLLILSIADFNRAAPANTLNPLPISFNTTIGPISSIYLSMIQYNTILVLFLFLPSIEFI